MSEQNTDIPALKREWLAARIVVIGGFLIAIAAGVYAGLVWRGQIVHARDVAAAAFAQEEAASATEEANIKAAAQFCVAALTNAKKAGIVPRFGQLTSAEPQRTKVTGRYLCSAATPSSKFMVTADLICRDLKSAKCVSLYSVTQNGSIVLYRRQD